MQLANIKKGWKPVSLFVGMMATCTVSMYADVDQYSHVDTAVNNHIAARYLAEVNDPSEARISDKLTFENLLASWKEETRFLSSIKGIIEQPDFQAIVAMGAKAVPFIGASIEAEPSTLVWALNLIFGTKITDKPDTTITEACRLWVKELKRQGWL